MTLNNHHIDAIRIRIEFGIESYPYRVYLAVFPIYDPKMTFYDLKMTFLTPLMTSGDLEKHPIEFKTKFAIDPYVYHVYLAIFPICDPKVTFLTLT